MNSESAAIFYNKLVEKSNGKLQFLLDKGISDYLIHANSIGYDEEYDCYTFPLHDGPELIEIVRWYYDQNIYDGFIDPEKCNHIFQGENIAKSPVIVCDTIMSCLAIQSKYNVECVAIVNELPDYAIQKMKGFDVVFLTKGIVADKSKLELFKVAKSVKSVDVSKIKQSTTEAEFLELIDSALLWRPIHEIITLVERNKEENSFVFEKEPYRYNVFNPQQKGPDLSARLTVTEIDTEKVIFRDKINFSRAPQRKRFQTKEFKDNADECLMIIDDQIQKIFKKEVLEELKPKQAYVMTNKERDVATNYLKSNPKILRDVLRASDKLGVVGEETNRLITYLMFTSRIMKSPLSLSIKGESSSGKSYTAQAIMKLIPDEGVVFITRATAQAFYHLPFDGLKHKIVYINELPGSESADYAIRSAQSEGHLTLMMPIKNEATGEMTTHQKTVEGPCGFLLTTTETGLFHENETRNFSIFTDDTPEQTERINRRIAEEGEGKEYKLTEKEFSFWKNIQRLLDSDLRVIIPFATRVIESFPREPLRVRRDAGKFKTLIEVITVLHQHQRKIEEIDGVKYIYATVADYHLALKIVGAALYDSIYQVPQASQDLLEFLKEKKEQFELDKKVGLNFEEERFEFCHKDIDEWIGYGKAKSRRLCSYLLRSGYIKHARQYKKNSTEARHYVIEEDKKMKEKFLISPKELAKEFPCDKKFFYDPFGKNVATV